MGDIKAKEEKRMVDSLMLDKAIDTAYRLLISGYRKLDTNRVFLSAYENALAAYKGEYKEDELYNELFKEKSYMYCDGLKEIIDVYLPTSELVDELRNQINEWLPDISIEKINSFIEKLFTELFFTNEYKDKILEYRKNDKIDQIYNMVLDLKRFISGQDKIEPMFQNNMFQYYLDKWSANLFLHREKKNKIELKDIYVLPFYKEKNSSNSEDIRTDLDDKIDIFLDDSIIGNRRRPMIILADAGMGKSSLVSYIASKCPQKDNVIILKFGELRPDSEQPNILSSVLSALHCKEDDLRNKKLIIDGFDESEFTVNKNRLLSKFFYECQKIQGLKILITSRVNYIDYMNMHRCKLYYLEYMTEIQVQHMCEKFFAVTHEESFVRYNSVNEKIIGVPLILYMILSLKIHIEKNSGICELYEKIFAMNGGIYDRMATDDSDGYTEEIHPVGCWGLKESVHLISQLIAFSMFESNSSLLAREKYMDIVKSMSEDRVEDFVVSNYYYIEHTTYSLSFCHRTIYEYFVAEYIYNILYINDEKEVVAERLAYLFKKNLLSIEILQFLKYKLDRNCVGKERMYLLIEAAANLMIHNGMTFYLRERIEDILKVESLIFRNINLILDSYFIVANGNNYKNIEIGSQFLSQINNRYDNSLYLNHFYIADKELKNKKYLTNLDLSHSECRNVNFSGSDLSALIMEDGTLISCYLNNVKLNGASFNASTLSVIEMNNTYMNNGNFQSCIMEKFQCKHTFFRETSFEGAKITDGDFSDADLYNAKFQKTILTHVDLSRARNVGTIEIDDNCCWDDVIVSIDFVPKLLKCKFRSIKGLMIYDMEKREKMNFDEYCDKYVSN